MVFLISYYFPPLGNLFPKTKTYMRLYFQTLLLVTCFALSSCNRESEKKYYEYSAQLGNIGNDVILPTFENLQGKSEALRSALILFRQLPNENSLAVARQAWRDARVPWEQSQAFLFGPASELGTKEVIDSWPINEAQLVAATLDTISLTKAYIDGLDGHLKGFHAIEYLLFGPTGQKELTAFTDRELEYMEACSHSLVDATLRLRNAWGSQGEYFVSNFLHAGDPEFSDFESQQAALIEVATGLAILAAEVANEKLHDPLVHEDASLVESRFSANSKQDLTDNIRSIRNVYLGLYENTTGVGLSSIVQTMNASLDEEIKHGITSAIESIDSIQGKLTHAIFYAKTTVQQARGSVNNLHDALELQLLPLIAGL
jgi:putative iron-regulated protein